MALTAPYQQKNYMGEWTNVGADDAEVLAFIQANAWDSDGDGTGDPINGMWYYESTNNVFRGRVGGSWTSFATAAGTTLASAYAAGPTISTTTAIGDLQITVGEGTTAFTVVRGTDQFKLSRDSDDNKLALDADLSTMAFDASAGFSIDGSGAASNLSSTSQNLTVSTITGGVLAVTSAGTLDMDGVAVTLDASNGFSIDGAGAASNLSSTSQNLSIQTLTSGTLFITSAGTLNVDGVAVQIDATDDSNLTMAANVAAAKTLTIAATNADGGGTAALDVNVDDAITIDSTNAGVSIDGASASNFTVAGANLTLSTTTTGAVNVTAADGIAMSVGADDSCVLTLGDSAGASTFAIHDSGGDDLLVSLSNGFFSLLDGSGAFPAVGTYFVGMPGANPTGDSFIFGGLDKNVRMYFGQPDSGAVTAYLKPYDASGAVPGGGVYFEAGDGYDNGAGAGTAGGQLLLKAGAGGDGSTANADGGDLVFQNALAGGGGGSAGNTGDTIFKASAGATIATLTDTTFAMDLSSTIDLQAGGAVTIDSSGGAINIGSDANAQAINIGNSAAARTITVGNASSTEVQIDAALIDVNAGATGLTVNSGATIAVVSTTGSTWDATTLSIDSTDTTNFTMTADNAGAKTLTITAANAGAGTGLLDINADDAITIDSTNAGVSIDGAGASNFTTSSGALTLDGNGGVNIAGNAAEIAITTTGALDINSGATTLDATTLSIDSTDTTNLTMTADDAGNKTLTIAASNAGAGNGLLAFSAFSASFDCVVSGVTPTDGAHLTTKTYVDGLVQGLSIKNPVQVGNMIADNNGGPPGVPVNGDSYIVDVVSGGWSAFAIGDCVTYNSGWQKVADDDGSGNPENGLRCIVTGYGSGTAAGSFAGYGNYIAEYTTGTGWAFSNPADGWYVLVIGEGDYYENNGWVYDASTWILFSGAGLITAGNGLTKSGNIISALADTTGGANLATVMSVTANGLAVKYDDVTLGENGSNRLYVVGVPSLFEINGIAVGAGVTAANIDTLTDTSDASSLHVHTSLYKLFSSGAGNPNAAGGGSGTVGAIGDRYLDTGGTPARNIQYVNADGTNTGWVLT